MTITTTKVCTCGLGKNDNLPYEDFAKFDIRVGTILKAEAVPKSKKLLKLEVSFGTEIGTRVILAGIAGSYDPTMIDGYRVIAILNFAPRQMMGIESHGMLLACHKKEDNSVWLIQPGPVLDGTEVG